MHSPHAQQAVAAYVPASSTSRMTCCKDQTDFTMAQNATNLLSSRILICGRSSSVMPAFCSAAWPRSLFSACMGSN